ncbi:hypothetical protein RNJ44_03518 [Nakaseomyces bracarensis]|uniref:Genetic interactor of prohibitin 5, mitochondrial n=1 Tax=Nakaseomyces bracarensis TaxID=273131 RepID=A0ABR4NX51_9SACH
MYSNLLRVIDQLPILPLSKDIVHKHWDQLTTRRKTIFYDLVKAVVPCEGKPAKRDLLALLHQIHYCIEPQLSREKPVHLLSFERPERYKAVLAEWPRVSERELLGRVIDKLQKKAVAKRDVEVRDPTLLGMLKQYHYLISAEILPNPGKTVRRRRQMGYTFGGYNDTPVTLQQLTPFGDLESPVNHQNRARRHLHSLYRLLDSSYPAISTQHRDTLTSQLTSSNRGTNRLYTQLLVQGYTYEENVNGITYKRIK